MVTGGPEGRTEGMERGSDRRKAQTGRTSSKAAWWERRPLDSVLHSYSAYQSRQNSSIRRLPWQEASGQRARGECRSLWLSPAMCPLKTSRSLKHTGRSEHKSRGSAIGSAVRSGAPGRTPSWEGLRRWRAVVPVLPPIEVFRFPAEVTSRSPVGLPRQVFNSGVP